MNKIILIDGSNLLHRSLHIPDVFMLEYNGVKTGGVHSFIRSLMMICKTFGDYPIVFWDKGFSERRISLFPNYKKRLDKDSQSQSGLVEPKDLEYLDQYRKQRAIINKILDAFGVPNLLIPQTEADDMIYYFTKQYKDKVSCIMSEDLDYLQLLDMTDVFLPMRKVYYTNKQDIETGLINYTKIHDIKLKNLSDLEFESTRHYLISKAMKGDPSDNIPGAKGIGEVSARKLALEYIKNPEYIEELKNKPKLGAYERKLLSDIDGFNLALDLIDLSKEEFSKEKISDILNQVNLTMQKSPDLMSLIGTFGEYGLQQIINDLQSYLRVLGTAKVDIVNIFKETP